MLSPFRFPKPACGSPGQWWGRERRRARAILAAGLAVAAVLVAASPTGLPPVNPVRASAAPAALPVSMALRGLQSPGTIPPAPTFPSIDWVEINYGAAYTTVSGIFVTVQARVDCPTGSCILSSAIVGFQLSEDPSFVGAVWQDWEGTPSGQSPYDPSVMTVGYALSSGAGTKVVYARVRDDWPAGGHISATASATIVYTKSFPWVDSVKINDGAAYTRARHITVTVAAWIMCARPACLPEGIQYLQVSEDPSFAGAVWQDWKGTGLGIYTPSVMEVPYTLSAGDGTKTVYARVRDLDPYVQFSQVGSATIVLDTVAPSGQVTINAGARYTATRRVRLSPAATDESGVSQIPLSEDPSFAGTEWRGYQRRISFTLSAGDGPKMVWARFQDGAGNISRPAADSILLDTVPPAAQITAPADGSALAALSRVTGTATDPGNGSGVTRVVAAVVRRVGGDCYFLTRKGFRRGDCDAAFFLPARGRLHWRLLLRRAVSIPGNYSVLVVAEDAAGNANYHTQRGTTRSDFTIR